MPVCVSCSDTITNGAETAVDCGGGVCDTCGERGACVAATDCTSKQCDANECTSCVNGVKDGVETGIDCGGATCAGLYGGTCAVGGGCVADGDCNTGKCDTSVVPNVCAAKTPADTCLGGAYASGAVDLLKTDVDCGGADCAKVGKACVDGQTCGADADCASGQCRSGKCTSCSNSAEDGGETDVDCGGNDCSPCADAKECLVATDCASGQCEADMCTSCVNQVKDGTENGVDCGIATVALRPWAPYRCL